MKTNKVLVTDAVRTVKRTLPRFISIIAIVALGKFVSPLLTLAIVLS